MTAFDPTQVGPDFTGQRDALMRAYNQGLINLNASKNNLFTQQGFLNPGDYTNSGNALDFSKLSVDPNNQYGGYRQELKSEADMLDSADAGPNRGFSGGVANQAKRTAQQAVASRQQGYQQNLQSQLGNLNLQAGNQSFNYGEGLTGINNNATEYAANAALWQGTNSTGTITIPGSSGGGSTPIKPQTITATMLKANPRAGQVFKNTGVTPFGPISPAAYKPTVTTARGGHAT